MLKIFITIPWFIPAFRAGGPIQSVANLVKEFNQDVRYFIFTSDVDLNGAALENIKTNEWVEFNPHTNVWYAGPDKISDTLVKQVEKVKPDILYIIGLFSWHFNMVPVIFCKAPRKILSTRGMLHPGALSQKKWKKTIFIQLFKLMEYHFRVSFHATDEEEKKFIKARFGDVANIFVADNFPNKIGLLPFARKEVGYLKLVSIALISPMKNILLVLQALGKVKEQIQYDIYGPVKDENYRDECLMQIRTLPSNVAVFFHREIEPGEVKDVLQNADVFILPSKSENFGHAMYEGLSAGLPLITSHHTPWVELKKSGAGWNVDIDNPEEIAIAIQFFASRQEEEFNTWRLGAAAYAGRAIDEDLLRENYAAMFFNSPSGLPAKSR